MIIHQNFTDLEVKRTSVEATEGLGVFAKRPFKNNEPVLDFHEKILKCRQIELLLEKEDPARTKYVLDLPNLKSEFFYKTISSTVTCWKKQSR